MKKERWNTTDGSQGLYLGLAYDAVNLNNADMFICSYHYTGSPDDKFDCKFGYFSEDGSNFTVAGDEILDFATLIADSDSGQFAVELLFPPKMNETDDMTPPVPLVENPASGMEKSMESGGNQNPIEEE